MNFKESYSMLGVTGFP